MPSEYFEGVVERIIDDIEEVKTPHVKKLGWFRREVSYTIALKPHHYAICSLIGTKFLLKVFLKEEYPALKVGDSVSLHLEFKFEYAAFHYERPKEAPKIIEVKRAEYD